MLSRRELLQTLPGAAVLTAVSLDRQPARASDVKRKQLTEDLCSLRDVHELSVYLGGHRLRFALG